MNVSQPTLNNTAASPLPACPATPEESWRRSSPKPFFPAADQILLPNGSNFTGTSESTAGHWHISPLDDSTAVAERLKTIETALGCDLTEWFEEHHETTSVLLVGAGVVEHFVNSRSQLNASVSLRPAALDSSLPGSPIGASLATRLNLIAGEELVVEITKTGDTPATLLVITMGGIAAQQSYATLKIVAKRDTRFSLALVDATSGFSHHRHELVLEKNAHLSQSWIHASNGSQGNESHALIERVATLNQGAELLGAEIFQAAGHSRIISNLTFAGEGSRSKLAAAIVASQSDAVDYEPVQTHTIPGGSSSLKVKILADDHATVAFQGLIDVAKPAVRTSALQENKNLILSKTARINASPRLQILPDDVQCKHGSATGEIDPRQVYYLTTRGFTEEQARGLIVNAFVTDALSVLTQAGATPLVALSERFLAMAMPAPARN
jgi:hypothetical protein